MNFSTDKSVDITEYFLDSLITSKSLKLVDNFLNQFNYQYCLIILLIISEMRNYARRKMEGQPEYLEGRADQI